MEHAHTSSTFSLRSVSSMGMKDTSKAKQKSSVDQFGHSPESAHSKSEKMENYHQAYIKQKKK